MLVLFICQYVKGKAEWLCLQCNPQPGQDMVNLVQHQSEAHALRVDDTKLNNSFF
jgi:hypothetical protein